MIEITTKGEWPNTLAFLKRLQKGDNFSDLDRYGRMGVEALSRATPSHHSGLTSRSWEYRIIKGTKPGIEWYNTNIPPGGNTPVAILIQYGHGTGTGGYVQGYDYINPAARPIFDKIADEIWKKVNS